MSSSTRLFFFIDLMEYTKYLPFVKEFIKNANDSKNEEVVWLRGQLTPLPIEIEDVGPYVKKVKALENKWRSYIKSIRVYLSIRPSKVPLKNDALYQTKQNSISICKGTYGPFNSIIDYNIENPVPIPAATDKNDVYIFLGASGTGKTSTLEKILKSAGDLKLDNLIEVDEFGLGKNKQSINETDINNLTQLKTKANNNLDEYLELVKKDRERRQTILATVLNNTSSRSHLMLKFKKSNSNNTITFYDLAGNESTEDLIKLYMKETGKKKSMTILDFQNIAKPQNPVLENLILAINQSVFIVKSLQKIIEYLSTSGYEKRTKLAKCQLEKKRNKDTIICSIHKEIYPGTMSNVTVIGHIFPLENGCTYSTNTLELMKQILFNPNQ